ncbi:hypothetical protein Pla52o_25540 [Novipirellula galeiformis]|uniref:Uncharacterized protein n=1 Tax=Novipirellula galeiformis TaxID=2528004 RepID=A0A5C6CEI8_9BACT|nr:hypothetical protein Pla52o_25540 [Novipirellula galeiformis]
MREAGDFNNPTFSTNSDIHCVRYDFSSENRPPPPQTHGSSFIRLPLLNGNFLPPLRRNPDKNRRGPANSLEFSAALRPPA